eukprot:350436-Chlamydomonas_euryale.AAC.21
MHEAVVLGRLFPQLLERHAREGGGRVQGSCVGEACLAAPGVEGTQGGGGACARQPWWGGLFGSSQCGRYAREGGMCCGSQVALKKLIAYTRTPRFPALFVHHPYICLGRIAPCSTRDCEALERLRRPRRQHLWRP